jgi:hypothetical protein
MKELIYENGINFVEDGIIILSLSLAVTYLVYTIIEYYKPRTLVDLGQTKTLI